MERRAWESSSPIRTRTTPPESMLCSSAVMGLQPVSRRTTPLLVEWKKTRIVLGSDLVNSGWKRVQSQKRELHRHAALKVAHHGSKGAQHACVVQPPSGDPPWIVTPWFRGPGLPRFEDGEGVARLLRNHRCIHVTRLREGVPPETTRQQVLEKGVKRVKLDDLAIELVPMASEASARESWLCAEFDETGQCTDIRKGMSVVTVIEDKKN